MIGLLFGRMFCVSFCPKIGPSFGLILDLTFVVKFDLGLFDIMFGKILT